MSIKDEVLCETDELGGEDTHSISLDEVFRGFEKRASVVVERAELPRIAPPKTKPILKKTSQPDLASFCNKCSVFIIRDDLAKLKALHKDYLPNGLDLKRKMSLTCKICKKIYESEKKLLNHQKNKHMIVYKQKELKRLKKVSFSEKITVHEVKEYHKCRKCPKIYEDYKLLKSHMKEQHKKRKCYICNYCAKKFVDRMFFKVHIKLHCEICGYLSPSKAKLVEHKRSICKIYKLHKCKTCNVAFFKFMDLKDHSYEHISTCYVCDICKDQFTTKCLVAHHIYFLHSKRHRRQTPSLYTKRKLGTESLFLCKFCEETSVDRDIIEAHIQLLPDLTNRAMTGYKDYYFCDQCLKKFDTEKDMLQHKWSHFLKSTDNSQERSTSILERFLTAPVTMPAEKLKIFYNINEKIPDHFNPIVVMEKLKIGGKPLTKAIPFVDVNCLDVHSGDIKKAVIDRVSKKTIISNHQCEHCGKYYSTNYCLNRHVDTQHRNLVNLCCKICEEVFIWPSLLYSHKCIRLSIPEMSFRDARPEIQFDNLVAENEAHNDGLLEVEIENRFDDLNIAESDNFMNTVDFEIPAPIVELNEYDNSYVSNNVNGTLNQLNQNFSAKIPFHSLGPYKVVVHEVPIVYE